MAEAQADQAFGRQLRAQFISKRRAMLRSIFERAVSKNELPSNADLDTAVDATYGAMWYRLLNRHGPLNKQFAVRLVSQIIDGLHVRRSPAYRG